MCNRGSGEEWVLPNRWEKLWLFNWVPKHELDAQEKWKGRTSQKRNSQSKDRTYSHVPGNYEEPLGEGRMGVGSECGVGMGVRISAWSLAQPFTEQRSWGIEVGPWLASIFVSSAHLLYVFRMNGGKLFCLGGGVGCMDSDFQASRKHSSHSMTEGPE